MCLAVDNRGDCRILSRNKLNLDAINGQSEYGNAIAKLEVAHQTRLYIPKDTVRRTLQSRHRLIVYISSDVQTNITATGVSTGSLDAFHAGGLGRRSGEQGRLSDSDPCVAIRDGLDLTGV